MWRPGDRCGSVIAPLRVRTAAALSASSTCSAGPGFYQRQLQIQRPGGTLERDMTIQRGFRPGFGGGGLGPRPPLFLGREVLMLPRPATNFSFGLMAAPLITIPFGVGAGVSSCPAPVAVGPAGPGGPGGSAPAQAQAVAAASDGSGRSTRQNPHRNSRRDGARELGRLGDPLRRSGLGPRPEVRFLKGCAHCRGHRAGVNGMFTPRLL